MANNSNWLGLLATRIARWLGGLAQSRIERVGRWWLRKFEASRQQVASWATWRHPIWILALSALVIALVLGRGPKHLGPSPPTPPTPAPTSQTQLKSSAIDPDIMATLDRARQESVSMGQLQVTALVSSLNQRVGKVFIPWYLSFGRRKLEEIRAYNTFAMSWIGGLASGNFHDESQRILVKTFEDEFSARVLTPIETRQALQAIGRSVGQDYGTRVMLGLQALQQKRSLSFAQWQRYLESLPSGHLRLADKRDVLVPMSALAAPDPIRAVLGDNIGNSLADHFSAFPSVASDYRDLQVRDGRNIFEIGRNAWAYYGSYVIYWIVLIMLVRSGLIPINLSGAVVGWLIWETFSWGSWITWESLDFEQTRLQLEPLIARHADRYFVQLQSNLMDPSASGPYQVLLALQKGWGG